MGYARNVLVLLGVALLSAYFMTAAYQRARNGAIEELYAQERILASQATKGIVDFFDHYKQTLVFFCRDTDVIQDTAEGRRLLRDWFLSQTNNLLSVTRVGPDGHILYTYPEEQAAGRDISDQSHIKTIFKTQQPVFSEVFTAVQRFQCVALHMPVFERGRFAGTLAAVFSFEVVSRRYVEGIRVGESGYALLVSREGIELYCPIREHVRHSIFESGRDYPSVKTMAERMLRGETGRCAYEYEPREHVSLGPVHKHAYIMPIPLENTFWSVCVTAPESEALSFIQGFRDRWLLGVAVLLLAFAVWGTFLVRAFLTIHRERTRRDAEARVREVERAREKELAASEARFRSYFEDSLLGMATSSPQKRWLTVNRKFAEWLGYSEEELRALSWKEVTHPEDFAAQTSRFDQLLRGEVESFSLEQRFLRKDRAVVHAIVSVRLLRQADGQADYFLAQFQDISERKQAEDEKSRLENNLRQAQKMEAIGQLAGGVAHDYNNLLTVQFGHVSMLRNAANFPPEARDSLDAIEKSAKMAEQLTRQLLAFSRRQVLQVKRLDLNEVLDQLLKMLRRLLREDISLELKMASEPLWLNADAGMMEQVLMNLVVNARDAMPGGGKLSLSTEAVEFTEDALPPASEARPGRFVCLAVADTGKGISAETRKRIFEPFFTTKEAGRGTGLGLATVYGIVKQHNGWIDVQSVENHGTVFRIFYPAAPAPANQPRPKGEPSSTTGLCGQGETILLAEDNAMVRKTLTASLERLNYRVVTAANSVEAMNAWEQRGEKVSLLLTDMVMPGGSNGVELAAALRIKCPSLPVVVMSGYSLELAAGGLSKDMVFLPKPCPVETLARTLRECLNHQATPSRAPAGTVQG